MTKQYTAAQINEFIRKAAAYDDLKSQGLLPDFSNTLENRIAQISKTVWVHEGVRKTSVDAAFKALGYVFKGGWNNARLAAQTFPSYYPRFDMPNGSPQGTICIALSDIEAMVLKLQPKRGRQVLTAFKQEHGLPVE